MTIKPNKCRAKSGAAACEDPQCPEKRDYMSITRELNERGAQMDYNEYESYQAVIKGMEEANGSLHELNASPTNPIESRENEVVNLKAELADLKIQIAELRPSLEEISVPLRRMEYLSLEEGNDPSEDEEIQEMRSAVAPLQRKMDVLEANALITLSALEEAEDKAIRAQLTPELKADLASVNSEIVELNSKISLASIEMGSLEFRILDYEGGSPSPYEMQSQFQDYESASNVMKKDMEELKSRAKRISSVVNQREDDVLRKSSVEKLESTLDAVYNEMNESSDKKSMADMKIGEYAARKERGEGDPGEAEAGLKSSVAEYRALELEFQELDSKSKRMESIIRELSS